MKRLIKISFMVLVLGLAIVLSNCDSAMGFGDPVDLVPPVVQLTRVEYPDGTGKDIAQDDQQRIYLGPGVLFGKGAILAGRAQDNVQVKLIHVKDLGSGKEWATTSLSNADSEGWQYWSITLEGLEAGERDIEVTAYDQASITGQPPMPGPSPNIGAETVKQITLLVDTDPPFVDKVYIERSQGIFADLLPRSFFNGRIDENNFEHIDYFQNKRFIIRAEISHEFSMEEAVLNLIDENGNRVFQNPLKNNNVKNNKEEVYNPYWEITDKMLESVNPSYASGKHYFKVSITAVAKAGHTGENDLTNDLYNLCWYPESDLARIKIELPDAKDNEFTANKNSVFPMHVFDDDAVKEVYFAIVSADYWNTFRSGTESEKLKWVCENKDNFYETGSYPLKTKRNKTTNRSEVIPVETPDIGEYRLIALVYDYDKNTDTSMLSSKIFTMDVVDENIRTCELLVIVCETPDGAYKNDGAQLEYKMIFNSKVFTTGEVSLTIRGGGNANQGAPVKITMTPVSQDKADFYLTGNWLVQEGYLFDPVTIESINIQNVRRDDEDVRPAGSFAAVINDYNSSRTGLKVLSVKPYITHINGQPVSGSINEVFPSADYGNDSLVLTFSHAVYPENGTITVKPAEGWLLPPVLTNDEFSRIINAVNNTDKDRLTKSDENSYYIRTTHGLRNNGTHFVPDTSTKYVLNFTSDISGINANPLKAVLDRAEFNWQKIDVNNVLGQGSNTITVNLDNLPDGRRWKLEITGPGASVEGSFRDDAGNTFAGYGEDTAVTFWSQNVSTPVIRVERVSNNHPTINPLDNINNTIAVPSIKGTTDEEISQINVRYRIDCETPGASITYGTLTDRAETITNTMVDPALYAPRAVSGPQNSTIADATESDLQNIPAANSYAYSSGAGEILRIGDENLYTARKDYIKAVASRIGLNDSSPGYEGAFKTILVFRNFRPNSNNNTGANNDNLNTAAERFLKLEASNVEKGAVTISGFPMSYNGMDGINSKYFYRNRTYPVTGVENNTDWIWISWEIVSDFWFVPMIVRDPTPNTHLRNNFNGTSSTTNNPWGVTNEDWYVYSFHTYGNWSLRFGHYNPSSNRPGWRG